MKSFKQVLLGVLSAALGALLLAFVQIFVLQQCDLKLGCAGGAWLLVTFASVGTLLMGLFGLAVLNGLKESGIKLSNTVGRVIYGVAVVAPLITFVWLSFPS